LPWSEKLITQFEDQWEWGEMGLSSNYALPWSEALIKKYEDRWDFEGAHGLCTNIDLPWTLALIQQYENKWDYELLSINGGVYAKVFQPVIDESVINEYYAAIST
jgi:hypothetical protein